MFNTRHSGYTGYVEVGYPRQRRPGILNTSKNQYPGYPKYPVVVLSASGTTPGTSGVSTQGILTHFTRSTLHSLGTVEN